MIELAFDNQRAVLTESAALHHYDVGELAVVEPAYRFPGAVLAPWPNRVVDGRWTWEGTTYQLAITEPEHGHALHGLVHALRWEVVDRGPDAVTLAVDLHPQPGWPFPLHLAASYRLGPDGLASTITATNVGDRPCPYGVGTHPYMALRGAPVGDVTVDLHARTSLAVDERLAPLEKRPVGELSGPVDNAFTDLTTRQATVTTPDGFTTTLWGDESVRWWQLFVDDVIALEPMTCAPDALNSGDGIVILEPGDAHAMTWGLAFGRQPSTRSR